MSLTLRACAVCGVVVGAIRRLRDDSDSGDGHRPSQPVTDYVVPMVGITGVMTGLRTMVKNSELAKPKVLPGVGMAFGTGVAGGLVAGAVSVYAGTLIGSAIVDVSREYQRQQRQQLS